MPENGLQAAFLLWQNATRRLPHGDAAAASAADSHPPAVRNLF